MEMVAVAMVPEPAVEVGTEEESKEVATAAAAMAMVAAAMAMAVVAAERVAAWAAAWEVAREVEAARVMVVEARAAAAMVAERLAAQVGRRWQAACGQGRSGTCPRQWRWRLHLASRWRRPSPGIQTSCRLQPGSEGHLVLGDCRVISGASRGPMAPLAD